MHCKDGGILVDGRWVIVSREEGKCSEKDYYVGLLIISQSYSFTFDFCGSGGVCLVVSTHERAEVYEKLLHQILLHALCSSDWV